MKTTTAVHNLVTLVLTVSLALVGLSAQADTQTYYMITDHLGTPQMLTDQNQAVVWQSEQMPFGEVTQVTGTLEQPLRFPGQYADPETGYSYNYFWDYDPSVGRYLQSDPIGLDGGVNTYGYVEQNPVLNRDPFGLQTFICTRPLGGSAGNWAPPVINHTYACIGDPLAPSGMRCNSTTASSGGALDNTWPFGGGSPGQPTDPQHDQYSPETCQEEHDQDSCIESCIARSWQEQRPWYGVGPNGTDCQEYTDRTVDTCARLCQR